MSSSGFKRAKVRRTGRDGFTLIEILVALTILAFVMGGVYGVFKAAHDSIDRVDQRAALTQIGRVLVSDLARELASVYPLEIDLSGQAGGGSLPGLPGAPSRDRLITFVGQNEVDPDGRDVDTLRFTTVARHPRRSAAQGEGHPSYDLAEVLYYIDDDNTTLERGLVRQSNDLPGLATEDIAPEVQEISEYVVGMNLRYLDDAEEEPQWVDQWEDTESLPAALELTLFLTPDPEVRDLATTLEQGRVVTTLVRLPIRTPIVPVGAARGGPAGPGGPGDEGGLPGGEGPAGPGGGGFPVGPGGGEFPGGRGSFPGGRR